MNYFEYGEQEIEYLKSKDAKLGEVIDKLGHLYRPVEEDLYESIIHHIIGQQISSQAQRTIWKRIKNTYDPLSAINADSASGNTEVAIAKSYNTQNTEEPIARYDAEMKDRSGCIKPVPPVAFGPDVFVTDPIQPMNAHVKPIPLQDDLRDINDLAGSSSPHSQNKDSAEGDINPNIGFNIDMARRIASADTDELQSHGLSYRKTEYIQDFSGKVVRGEFDPISLRDMTDDEVIKELSALKGIGEWTAEMLMLFSMQRPNILSFGDLAILRGMRMVYHHRKIDRKLFEKYRRRLSPYCSTASLYFWAVGGGALPDMRDYAPKPKKKSSKK